VKNELDPDVVYVARLHWIIFVGPVLMMLCSLILTYNFPGTHIRTLTSFFAIIALIWALMVWVNYEFSSLTIKKKQLIVRTGLLVRFTTDIPLSRVESLDIRQTILGSLLQYGSLLIIGTGGSRQMIHYLTRPLTCRRHIEQLMHG